MTKAFIKRLLESTNISENDLNKFITEYTFSKLDKHISAEELSGISQLIKLNLFNLRYALLEAARSLDLNVITAINKNGIIVKTHVYESF